MAGRFNLNRMRRLLGVFGGMVLVGGLLAHPAIAGVYPDTREYLLGDMDGFQYEGAGGEDDVYVDQDWWDYCETTIHPPIHFDVVEENHCVPFTFLFTLAEGEHITAASLTLGLRASHSLVTTDGLDFDFPIVQVQEQAWHSELGWLPIPNTGVTVRTADLSDFGGVNLLPYLETGHMNCRVNDDTAVDYAMLSIEVMPEPATLALLGLGGLALAVRRRKR